MYKENFEQKYFLYCKNCLFEIKRFNKETSEYESTSQTEK